MYITTGFIAVALNLFALVSAFSNPVIYEDLVRLTMIRPLVTKTDNEPG